MLTFCPPLWLLSVLCLSHTREKKTQPRSHVRWRTSVAACLPQYKTYAHSVQCRARPASHCVIRERVSLLGNKLCDKVLKVFYCVAVSIKGEVLKWAAYGGHIQSFGIFISVSTEVKQLNTFVCVSFTAH